MPAQGVPETTEVSPRSKEGVSTGRRLLHRELRGGLPPSSRNGDFVAIPPRASQERSEQWPDCSVGWVRSETPRARVYV
jgi:hypothetical protein